MEMKTMTMQVPVSKSSGWVASRHKPADHEARTGLDRLALPGRLVAITATGPVYRASVDLAVVPVSVGLAFTQELAKRALNPQARVASSLANRVGGDTAREAWASTCGLSSAALVGASPRARLQFLDQVLGYVRRVKSVNGIEPILGAAVNAAWPWINPVTLARVLNLTSKHLRQSEFAATNAVPILDPNTRTFTLFAPGSLAKVDPDQWLDWRVVDRIGFGVPGAPGTGRGSDRNDPEGLLGRRGPDLGRLPGPDGRPGDSMGGDDFGGVVGDLLGPRGPNLGNLPGADGRPGSRDRRDDDLNGAVEGLLGSRRPSLAGLEGPDGRRRGDRGGNEFGGLLGDLLGPQGPDLGNLGGSGGPYGHGSGLAPGGAADPREDMKSTGATAKTFGMGLVAVGAGLVGAGLAGGGVGPGGVGVIAVATGFIFFKAGAAIEREAAEGTPAPATGEKPRGDGTVPTVDVHKLPNAPAVDVHKLPDAKGPKPGEPKHTDLYPDPDGTGGGHPTQLPDSDGSGGGNPTTLWDENGGGGNPTTLWDENGGGGNPTTTAEFLTAVALTGPGLLAGITQVGPATFAF
jgi:hypothetical protein